VELIQVAAYSIVAAIQSRTSTARATNQLKDRENG